MPSSAHSLAVVVGSGEEVPAAHGVFPVDLVGVGVRESFAIAQILMAKLWPTAPGVVSERRFWFHVASLSSRRRCFLRLPRPLRRGRIFVRGPRDFNILDESPFTDG